MKIRCSRCGRPVSGVEIPDISIIRAFIECPECIEKQIGADDERVKALEAELKHIDQILSRRDDPCTSRPEKIGNLIEIAKLFDENKHL